MNEMNEKEQMMRAYWLGVLDDDLIESAETSWFAGDEDAERLEIVRADLIDDYLAENLTEVEKSHFEMNFLPFNLEDVVLEKSSLEVSRENAAASRKKNFAENFLNDLRDFFGFRQLAAAALLLLVCCGLWLVFSARRASEEIARRDEPIFEPRNETRPDAKKQDDLDGGNTTENEKSGGGSDENPSAETAKVPGETRSGAAIRNKEPVKKQPDEKQNTEQPQILFLTVFRGTMKSVSLRGNSGSIILKLTMPGIDKAYQNYRLKIYDAAGKPAVSRDLGGQLSLRKSGDVVTMPPLRKSLFRKNNDYRTVLAGIDENGAENELISYDGFRIE